MQGKSKKAFEHNVETEMDAHPGNRAQNLAIAYAIQRRAKKKEMAMGGYADGGEMLEPEPKKDDGDDLGISEPIPMCAEGGLMERAMKRREQMYSQGGRVANDTPITAGFEENQFDDLVLRDDLESSYTGDNSGDEIGNQTHDDEAQDEISRLIRARRLRDRNPRPA
jgi:hypothetical protein